MSEKRRSVIEETFNLPPHYEEMEEANDLANRANTIIKEMSNSEKADSALTAINDLDDHDREMDDIAKKAIDSYRDLMDLGMNTADVHAGKIFEVAASMLTTALNAKNSKADRKLKQLALLIRKVKIDNEQNPEQSSGTGIDRNDIIEIIKKGALVIPATEQRQEPPDVDK